METAYTILEVAVCLQILAALASNTVAYYYCPTKIDSFDLYNERWIYHTFQKQLTHPAILHIRDDTEKISVCGIVFSIKCTWKYLRQDSAMQHGQYRTIPY